MTRKLLLAALLGTAFIPAAAQADELRMGWWGGDSRHKATQAAIEACGAKHGHTIKGEFTGFDGYLEKLTTQIAGSTEPDIMQVNWPWLPLFSKDGTGFVDLRGLSGLDLSQWREADLAASSTGGVLQGIPVSITGRAFFFNTTPLKKQACHCRQAGQN